MKHPVTGIVGDEGNFRALARKDEDGVLPRPMALRLPVARNHTEGMAVQVHGVWKGGLIH